MLVKIRKKLVFLPLIALFLLAIATLLELPADTLLAGNQEEEEEEETCQVEETNKRKLALERFEINNSQVNGENYTWIPGKLVPNEFNLGEFEPTPLRTFEECVELCEDDPDCEAFSTELSTFLAWIGGYLSEDELVHCHRKTKVRRKCLWDALDRAAVHVPGFRGGKNNVWMLEWGTFIPHD